MATSTWADGFGRWYADAPATLADPRRAARRAIRRELAARGEVGPGYRVRVRPVLGAYVTAARTGRLIFREV